LNLLNIYWILYLQNESDINVRKEGWKLKKSDRTMQGYNEIAAYYMDRVLGLYRKPPIVGRFISSKLLYEPGFNMKGILSFELKVLELISMQRNYTFLF